MLAAADIGSNTAHLLVGRFRDGAVQVLANDSEWLALGETVAREGRVPDQAAERLVETVKAFRLRARNLEAGSMYLFATEAFRLASNHHALISLVRERCGLAIEVIPPRREAELGLAGAMLDSEGPAPFIFAECGGGSLQLARVGAAGMEWERSAPVGTGALRARFEVGQPADAARLEAMTAYIRDFLPGGSDVAGLMRSVASGGVARGLVRALHADGERVLHVREIEFLAWDCARLTVPQIVARYRVKTQRAATLLTGATLFASLLQACDHETLTVSEHGVREGALLEIAQGRLEACQV